jgi:hypothetical protein
VCPCTSVCADRVPLHLCLRCSYDSAVPFGGYKDSGLGREKVRLLLLLLLFGRCCCWQMYMPVGHPRCRLLHDVHVHTCGHANVCLVSVGSVSCHLCTVCVPSCGSPCASTHDHTYSPCCAVCTHVPRAACAAWSVGRVRVVELHTGGPCRGCAFPEMHARGHSFCSRVQVAQHCARPAPSTIHVIQDQQQDGTEAH